MVKPVAGAGASVVGVELGDPGVTVGHPVVGPEITVGEPVAGAGA